MKGEKNLRLMADESDSTEALKPLTDEAAKRLADVNRKQLQEDIGESSTGAGSRSGGLYRTIKAVDKTVDSAKEYPSTSNEYSSTDKTMRLVGEVKQAQREGNLERELQYRFELARLDLKDVYDVDNLSNIEALHLRKIVEDVVRRDVNMARDQDPNTWRNIHTGEYFDRPEVSQEVSDRWLHELYGIDAAADNGGFRNWAEFKEAIRFARDKAHLI